jgi:hypothetical protein
MMMETTGGFHTFVFIAVAMAGAGWETSSSWLTGLPRPGEDLTISDYCRRTCNHKMIGRSSNKCCGRINVQRADDIIDYDQYEETFN